MTHLDKEPKMNSIQSAAVAAGTAAGALALVLGAPLWGGLLAFAGVGYVAQKAMQAA